MLSRFHSFAETLLNNPLPYSPLPMMNAKIARPRESYVRVWTAGVLRYHFREWMLDATEPPMNMGERRRTVMVAGVDRSERLQMFLATIGIGRDGRWHDGWYESFRSLGQHDQHGWGYQWPHDWDGLLITDATWAGFEQLDELSNAFIAERPLRITTGRLSADLDSIGLLGGFRKTAVPGRYIKWSDDTQSLPHPRFYGPATPRSHGTS